MKVQFDHEFQSSLFLYLDNHINDYQADLWPQNTEMQNLP